MKKSMDVVRPLILSALTLASSLTSPLAQEVSIPDPNFNAVIREALGKPNGPLTQQDMLSLTGLSAIFRNITNVQGLEAAQNLASLDLQDNRITSLNFPTNLTRLVFLDLSENRFPQLTLPSGMTNLTILRAELGGLTNVTLPAGLTKLTSLRLGFNQLPSLTLPADMTNLSVLSVYLNQLTNLTLPPTLTSLTNLNLDGNRLSSLNLPAGMTSLAFLNLNNNQLTNLTLPPNLQQLIGLFVAGNPLTTFVLSEPLAVTGMATVVDSLKSQGLSVFTYPLVAQLVRPSMVIGAFKFAITGPPGTYTVLGSTNLAAWSTVGVATNPLGSVTFHDLTTNVLPQKYYRVLLQVPPANMVFIPTNTFKMGTPANEVNRQADEGPQTTVTISHGFRMGKYEVTQREYLAVTGSNPSGFPGDLNRPVESVNWLDATNYCGLLTQQELAAGRIPPGSHYRLPMLVTEPHDP
jgi:hypothetical protein